MAFWLKARRPDSAHRRRFALLFDGLRLLVSNWRLTLVPILPAIWVWLAMADLKAHVLHGESFNVLRGPVLIPIILAIAAITVACFFLNAVFAFAITRPGATLQAGATGAVRAIKMSVSLTGTPHPHGAQPRVTDTEA